MLINLARGSLSTIPLMFATLSTIAAASGSFCICSSCSPSASRRVGNGRRISCPLVVSSRVALVAVARWSGCTRRRDHSAGDPVAAGAVDQADRRPRLHPERPVRAVLSGAAAGLLPRAGLDVTFQNGIDPNLSRSSARARSTSASPTARASSPRSARASRSSTPPRSTPSSRTSSSPRPTARSRRRPI